MCYARSMRLPDFEEERALDTERFARMTMAERLKLFLELCDLTDSIQRDRPNVLELRRGTPLSAEAEALWQRLIRRYRHG
jgi:hypothetical protein